MAVGPGRGPDLALGRLFPAVGEEDEVSIREAAEAVAEAMDFHGEVTVSFCWCRALRASRRQTAGLTRGEVPTLLAQRLPRER